MRKALFILLTFFSFTGVKAQYYLEEIDVSVGAGISVPYDEMGYFGVGLYAQAEYVLNMNEYMDLRPYAGYILTKMNGDLSGSEDRGDEATANAFLFGGKARFRIPIDWVAPYAEIGVGGSIGSFQTMTVNTDIDDNGVYAHIPFSIGVELGPQHKVNVELTSFFHIGVGQFTAAAAVGLRIPISYY